MARARMAALAALPSEDQNLILPPQQVRSRASLMRILGAAEIVLREEGVEAFSIARIAELSGVSVGGIYRRVKGKAELLQAVKDAAMARIEEAVSAAMEGQRFETFDAVVHALVRALQLTFVKDEILHRMLFRTGESDPVIAQRGGMARARMREMFVRAAAPLFSEPAAPHARVLAGVAYDLVTSTIISRVRAARADAAISWEDLAREMERAGASYLAAANAHFAEQA